MKVTAGFFAALLFAMSGSAHASETGSGLVHNVIVTNNGSVLFQLTGSRTTLPSCGTPNPTRWAFNGATGEGQAKLSLLLTAYSAGKQLVVHGTNTCSVWGDTETVEYFETPD